MAESSTNRSGTRDVVAGVILLLSLLLLSACGAGETLVVTQRPEPAYQPPADTLDRIDAPVATAGLDTVDLGEFPAGRMWTLDDLPFDYFEETYGFRPDTSWINRVRRATLRLPNCTAALVSADGLVVTNYHCLRDQLPGLAALADSVIEKGFLSDTLTGSLRAEELYADQLLTITDATDQIRSRIDHLSDDDRRGEVLRSTIESLEEQFTADAKRSDTTHFVEIVTLYSGARYAAYNYRRIHDLRLVLVPEADVGHFGGDTQNFTYPRYTLDVAFLRAYDDQGNPLASTPHFDWSEDGVEGGSAVFSAGNPGPTQRFHTLSQLQFERDFELPAELAVLGARAAALERFIVEHPAAADSFDVLNMLMNIRNVQKDARGRLAALNDPAFLRQVRARMAQTDAALAARDSLQQVYRETIRSIDAVQRTRRASASQTAPFAIFGSELVDSHVFIRAIYAYLYDFARQRGAPTDFVATYLTSGREVERLPEALEVSLLAARLRELQEHLGRTDQSVRTVLRGRTPEEAAREIVAGSALVDSVGFDSLVAAGYLSSTDTTVPLAEAIVPLYMAVAEQAGSLDTREDRLLAQLAEARLAVSDGLMPPGGTFSLRVSDGVVSGYAYNGTLAPPYTTFLGMYNAHYSFDAGPEFSLPERWLDPPAAFDRETPLNFVATIDMTGGSSGSPVFTADLSLVGVAFDSNAQGLRNAYLFSENDGRGIAVDARAITEALRDMYGASALVEELRNGTTASAE